MARKCTLLNTKVVPADSLPLLCVASSASLDVIIDTVIVTNTDGSSHNYQLLIAEAGSTTPTAIVSTNAIGWLTAEIGNLAWIPFDITLTGGQALYVESDSDNNLTFRAMWKKFSAGALSE